ncbi:MAG: HEAT repeat domain-containing protein [Planctomycetaceae bacterium]
MRLQQKYIVIPVVMLVIAAVVWALFAGPGEPTYNGKSLSQWLDEHRPTPAGPVVLTDEAEQAVREIGPEAVPFLLDWVQRPDAPGTQSLRYGVGIPIPLNDVWRERAIYGFRALGDAAEPAIPQLVELAFNADDHDIRNAAVNSLTSNHPMAVKLLLQEAQSSDSGSRSHAASVLGRL